MKKLKGKIKEFLKMKTIIPKSMGYSKKNSRRGISHNKGLHLNRRFQTYDNQLKKRRKAKINEAKSMKQRNKDQSRNK